MDHIDNRDRQTVGQSISQWNWRTIALTGLLGSFLLYGILYLASVRVFIEFSPHHMAVRSVKQICIPFTLFAPWAPEIGERRRSALMQWLVDEGFAPLPEGAIGLFDRE